MVGENKKFVWTRHTEEKMRYYRLTESRIKRIIRHPARVEEGILAGAIACMQPAGGKNYSEIWTMYILVREGGSRFLGGSQIKIITAWRYPGKSPARNPIPAKILREVKSIL